MKVLIVEDNELNMELIVQLLEDDYEILTAENGQEGLDSILNDSPDLVLLDLSMPVMDGWEVLEAIRTRGLLEGVPVVVLSAHANRGDRKNALEAGATDFLTKPVDEDKLLDMVERMLTD